MWNNILFGIVLAIGVAGIISLVIAKMMLRQLLSWMERNYHPVSLQMEHGVLPPPLRSTRTLDFDIVSPPHLIMNPAGASRKFEAGSRI